MKIVTIIGARPQIIKSSQVSRVISQNSSINEIIIHTGQHFDSNMSDIFLKEMQIPKPSYNLGIFGLNHGAMTGRMMEKIEEILMKETPDIVLVYGDTNSTIAGALAAKKIHIKVAHVEAGLRSFNMKMPEEINRVLTDRISDILFCPTDKAVNNLKQEGFEHFSCKIHKCGDVMFDAALNFGHIAEKQSSILKKELLEPKNYLLVTVHRAENTDDITRLKIIFDALTEISNELPVIFPIHPRTKAFIKKWEIKPAGIKLIEPIGYLDMIMLEKNARLISTDSGGVQKEAFFHGVPCVTLRDETEWVELIDGGYNMLAPPLYKSTIINAFKYMLDKKIDFTGRIYGDGKASEQIVEHIL
ncbi:MAG: UDP-N-acetylglucosamine 2-epimerase (non-hydrolyzing) [Desulfobacterales bacterium]|nr:UDP-N-acetylglucosamine 2-epimerase (non-hydrolyzing) [Desulfobacterales bacterium]